MIPSRAKGCQVGSKGDGGELDPYQALVIQSAGQKILLKGLTSGQSPL